MSWSIDQLRQAAKSYSNWNRWGEDDQVGALNYVTPEKIVQASRLIRKGKVFSLSIPFGSDGPQFPGNGRLRFNPVHVMLRTGTDLMAAENPENYAADDLVIMPLQSSTQWDGLSHAFNLDRKMYNDRDATMVSSQGAAKNGIEHMRDKIVGRGVLLDIPRYKTVDWLLPDYGISPDDLDGCLETENVEVGSGDFLLIRTGIISKCRQQGTWGDYISFGAGAHKPGLTLDTLEWLYKRQVASVAADTSAVEVTPNSVGTIAAPWHKIAIPYMGLLVGEIFDLEELAIDCSIDKVYEFFFVAPVIPITGAVGSPVNPIAIK